jgi:sec-independent protein translocase protein TatC
LPVFTPGGIILEEPCPERPLSGEARIADPPRWKTMAFDDEDDLFKHTAMTFGEHLEELRAALFKAVLALAIGFGIGLYFATDIVRLIQAPLEIALEKYYSEEAVEFIEARLPDEFKKDPDMVKLVKEHGLVPELVYVSPDEMLGKLRAQFPEALGEIKLPASAAPKITKEGLLQVVMWRQLSDDERVKLRAFNIQEGFVILLKAALLFGAVLSSPFVFYFLWSFVAAGLYPHEKKYVHTFLPVSLGLFIAGAALAFTAVFPPVLDFFFRINKAMGQIIEPRISEWLSFVLLLPLGFGVAFQLPLVMLFLERIHVFSAGVYLSKWRIAVLLMAIASMVLSPGGDPYSMMFMLGPLVILYFGGIALCYFLPTRGSRTPEVPKPKEYAGVD